jgi:hypothetical protein
MSATGESVNLVPSFNPMSVASSPGGNGTTNVQIVAPVLPAVPKTILKVETELQKAAFKAYLDLGPGRSIEQLLLIRKGPLRYVKEKDYREWAILWDWRKRIEICDLNDAFEAGMIFLKDFKLKHPSDSKSSLDINDIKKYFETLKLAWQNIMSRHEEKKLEVEAEVAVQTGHTEDERGPSGGTRQMVIVNITGR